MTASTAISRVVLDDLACLGTEEHLFDCAHPGVFVHNCKPGIADAHIICGTTGINKLLFLREKFQ